MSPSVATSVTHHLDERHVHDDVSIRLRRAADTTVSMITHLSNPSLDMVAYLLFVTIVCTLKLGLSNSYTCGVDSSAMRTLTRCTTFTKFPDRIVGGINENWRRLLRRVIQLFSLKSIS